MKHITPMIQRQSLGRTLFSSQNSEFFPIDQQLIRFLARRDVPHEVDGALRMEVVFVVCGTLVLLLQH